MSRNCGKSDEETLYFEELAKTAPVMVLSRRGPAILRVVKDLPEQHRVIYTKSDDTASGHARRARKRPFKDFMDGDSNISGAEPHIENTGSSSHMKLASLWLRNCLQNHDLCNTGVSSGHRLPRRLIDVSDPERPFLVNVAALPKDRKATQYVALSYCWGEGERVMTETTNYEAHLKCIPAPHKTLPKTFVDAFKVTHGLGFQYIWTDAFCMIQDSPEDKHDELPKMGDIYRISAEVTLATKCMRTDFLEPRGWILQEEILACRRLLFGTQMSWRCVGSDASEVCPVPSPKTRVTGTLEGRTEDKLRMWLYEANSVKSRPAVAQGSRANHFDAWYSILEVYSLKELSFIGDVLAAVDGLANMFSQAHKVKYLAGVWQEDLQLGLAWFVSNNERRNVEPYGNKWPSWSWASVGKVAIRFRKWPRYGVAVEDMGAELINATCQASCVPPIAGKLVIRARVRAAFIKYRRVRFPAVLYEDRACDLVLGTAALDRPLYGLDAGTDLDQPINVHSVVLALLHAQKTGGGEHAVYLVLGKKQDGSDYYVRRGVAFLDRSISGLALETLVIV
ncbi:hypothetical protein Micbo1qcDRAFT_202801 [Microdochium bolleyi]|uniref:Heterokaryon incompatibility domain-containing protein n=1 Tax=Microdochium bolleyi TaxID=196109 RepID=A0A136J6E7_9PEZI|nr:hypothetical protein Micbo1qcDRAFT_202801 [Microdochium bolleyi]